MLNEKKFNSDELVKVEYQFLIKHETPENFNIGEKVFLKSNPEIVLLVHSIKNDKVLCYWYSNGEIQFSEFPPECVLQYKYRVLLSHSKINANICLN